MALISNLNKVLVIGSGPIVIGQAAEFDYAGTQACRALKEEGIEVILVNSNPATIMTDRTMADRTYIEPLTVDFLEKIIAAERPDGLLATLGGQVGLNLAIELSEKGILDQYNVRLLGTCLKSIKKAEDRELFKDLMEELKQPVPESAIVTSLQESIDFANTTGYPLIVRPAYTLGGTGGGIAANEADLVKIVTSGLKHSMISQVLIERSVAGWREVEYEVIRDGNDNCIIVCNMENIDPVGVHTGDSIVVAPSQTLSDAEYHMLRTASINIIRALEIEGGCNVQYALDPHSMNYYVIEVNPRVSRSSALASKATGYPIAKVATKIAIGYRLDEIVNTVTGRTKACFEPALDYVVIKFPRWPFDKFLSADRSLGTQMKATGEVMAIDRTFEGALLKGIRSLEIGLRSLYIKELESFDAKDLISKLTKVDDERLFAIAELLRRGMTVEEIISESKMDKFFIQKLHNIVYIETALRNGELTEIILKTAKKYSMPDSVIAKLSSRPIEEVKTILKDFGIDTCFKMVDTCAAEFDAMTPYYYSTFGKTSEVKIPDGKKVIVLGSGPIRIGQGIEFDYCAVHAVKSLRKVGVQAVTINNNPETVSTDFDTADRLYFEPLNIDDVLKVIDLENPDGVLVQFGGQTAINLAHSLEEKGVKILGSGVECIDNAENREKFDALLEDLDIQRPKGVTVFTVQEALDKASLIGYPVVVRPSYVLGGRAMEIVYGQDELIHYLKTAVQISNEQPILIDRYMQGLEVEVDAIADGETVVIPGIMEHIERAGVHSGDSIAIYPAVLNPTVQNVIIDYTTRIAKKLNVRGLINIQFVVVDEKTYVLEVNPRASRTVPILSKVTDIPMVEAAVRVSLGESLASQGYQDGLVEPKNFSAIKVPVFSFGKMKNVDVSLGPEMKSTGEVLGLDEDTDMALYKGLIASGLKMPSHGTILFTVADKDKKEATHIARQLATLGYKILATDGTAKFFNRTGIKTEVVAKLGEDGLSIVDHILKGNINMVVNTVTKGKEPLRDGFKIRRTAVEHAIPCITSLDTLRSLSHVITNTKINNSSLTVKALQDFVK